MLQIQESEVTIAAAQTQGAGELAFISKYANITLQ